VRHAIPHLTNNTAERRAFNWHPLRRRRARKGEAVSANKGSTLESQGIKA